MQIGARLKALRESKKLSQSDVARATGLVPPYISRVENGYTTPGLDTLEKWARALDMQLYQVMYDGDAPPEPLVVNEDDADLWGKSGRQALGLNRLKRALSKMTPARRETLMAVAARLARSRRKKQPTQ